MRQLITQFNRELASPAAYFLTTVIMAVGFVLAFVLNIPAIMLPIAMLGTSVLALSVGSISETEGILPKITLLLGMSLVIFGSTLIFTNIRIGEGRIMWMLVGVLFVLSAVATSNCRAYRSEWIANCAILGLIAGVIVMTIITIVEI